MSQGHGEWGTLSQTGFEPPERGQLARRWHLQAVNSMLGALCPERRLWRRLRVRRRLESWELLPFSSL